MIAYAVPMHANADLITRFYTAFSARNADGMVACYADDIEFSDPVFPGLRGEEAKSMWRMLAGRSKDLVVTFSDVHADDRSGRAHWEATYTFSATGRKVHNIIDAKFEFRDGKIVRHTDHFDLYRWMRLAMGGKGVALGWLPPVQGALRKKARAGLVEFMAQQAAK